MAEQLRVKQGTIVCQICGKIIDAVESPEGVKTWYGKCAEECSSLRENA